MKEKHNAFLKISDVTDLTNGNSIFELINPRAVTWQQPLVSFKFLVTPVIKFPHSAYTPEDAFCLIYNV